MDMYPHTHTHKTHKICACERWRVNQRKYKERETEHAPTRPVTQSIIMYMMTHREKISTPEDFQPRLGRNFVRASPYPFPRSLVRGYIPPNHNK